MIEVYIADSTALVREGLKTVIGRMKDVHIVGEAENLQELSKQALRLQPDVLVLNYASKYFSIDKIGCWKNFMPNTKILAITPEQTNEMILRAMEAGVKSHVMVHCSEDEITDAIKESASQNKRSWAYISGILERWHREGREGKDDGKPSRRTSKSRYI